MVWEELSSVPPIPLLYRVLAVLLLSHMLDIFPPSADTEAMQFIDQYYIMSEMLEWAGHVGVKYGSHVGVKCGNHA